MSYSQYVGWQEYYGREPFGEQRADLRAGIVASVIANVNRDSSSKPEPYHADDFIPKFGDDAREAESKPLVSNDDWSEIKRKAVQYAKGGAFTDATVQRRTNRVPVPTP